VKHQRSKQLAWTTLAALILVFLAGGPAVAINVNDIAPNFMLVDIDGGYHMLSAEASHPVLIFFFDCNGSTALAQRVQGDIESRYDSQGLIVLGIDVGSCDAPGITRFGSQSGADFPLLKDGRSTLSDYGMQTETLVLVDAFGVVKYVSPGTGIGSYNESEVKTAVEQALRDAANSKALTWGVIKNLYK